MIRTLNEHYYNYVIYLQYKKVCKNNKLLNKNLSSFSIKSYLSQLRAFLNYCYSEGYIIEKIHCNSYKTRKNTVVVLSYDQIRQIINYYDINTFLGCRNLLIISLMIDCGLRLKEVINLNVIDINVDLNLICVNGKGDKQRLVPLSETTKKYFLIYINYIPVDSILFYTYNLKPLTAYGVSILIKKLKKELKFSKLNPHYLRHTFATLFLLIGGNPLHLQIILGHTTLTMTQNYVHIANQMSISTQKSFAPLSNLKD